MATKTGSRAAKAQAQKAGASSRQIKVQFTLDPDSHTGKLFELAVEHYSGGAIDKQEFRSLIARKIVQDWLGSLIQFPTIYMEGSALPAKRRANAEGRE